MKIRYLQKKTIDNRPAHDDNHRSSVIWRAENGNITGFEIVRMRGRTSFSLADVGSNYSAKRDHVW